jgi:hypothetical protein
MEDLNLSGRLDTDMQWDTRMSYIENEQFEQVRLDGRLIVEGMLVETSEIPVPIQLEKMAMYFTPRFVNLETLDVVMGASDLHMDGRLTNFIPYVFDDQTVGGTLNVTSALLDVNELMPAEEDAGEPGEKDADDPGSAEKAGGTEEAGSAGDAESTENTEGGTKGQIPADTLAPPTQTKIPENIALKLTLNLQQVIYDNIVIERLQGNARVQEGVAYLEGLTMELLEGDVSLAGVVDPRGEFTSADVQLDMSDIDIPSSYETFVANERLAPIAQ